jgi:large subunit ribosomal protein L4e
MFAPTKVWRKWHRRVNVNLRRTAAAAALAGSALPALVMARGHRVDRVPEVPLVVNTKTVQTIDKTSKAVALLKALNAYDDVDRVIGSKKIRVGAGKARNRRYVQRTGPLVVYSEKGPFLKAFRNIPGIDLVNVSKLSVLDLAPGGHLGRFIIYTKDAFQALDTQFGTYKTPSSVKKGFQLPKPLLTNADLGRIINSEEVQSQLREKRPTHRVVRKKNPYKNFQFLVKLNPYAKTLKRQRLVAAMRAQKAKQSAAESKSKGVKTDKKKATKPTRAKAFRKALLA